VSFALARGETVGIVGESGSGKSMTALGVAQLVSYPGNVAWRELRIDDVELAGAAAAERRKLLGSELALVSQDPMTALNPALRVGRQLAEVAQVHRGMSRTEANQLAVNQLRHVRIDDPQRRARQFPHEFSGGMRQRAVIAMGLMGAPKLIIADEPTTALDVTVQRQVLALLSDLNTETGAAILLISHDIAVVTNVCQRVLVMYGGRIVEDASSDQLLADAAHPYARALLAAVPTMDSDRDRELAVIPGRPPTLADMPPGCSFAARCPLADEQCRAQTPPLVELAPGRRAACWHPQGSHKQLVEVSA
jgi:peptide/nickel transport system permease protein